MILTTPFLLLSTILAPLVSANACNADNCLRALRRRSITASPSCRAFATSHAIPLPTYATPCSGTSRYSSACSCLLASSTTATPTCTTSAAPVPPPSPTFTCSVQAIIGLSPYPSLAPPSGTILYTDQINGCALLCLNYPAHACHSFQVSFGDPTDGYVCTLFGPTLQGLQLRDIGIPYAPPLYDISCFGYKCA